MLRPYLHGHAQRGLALRVLADADDAAGQQALELLMARQEGGVGAAVAQRHTKALQWRVRGGRKVSTRFCRQMPATPEELYLCLHTPAACAVHPHPRQQAGPKQADLRGSDDDVGAPLSGRRQLGQRQQVGGNHHLDLCSRRLLRNGLEGVDDRGFGSVPGFS